MNTGNKRFCSENVKPGCVCVSMHAALLQVVGCQRQVCSAGEHQLQDKAGMSWASCVAGRHLYQVSAECSHAPASGNNCAFHGAWLVSRLEVVKRTTKPGFSFFCAQFVLRMHVFYCCVWFSFLVLSQEIGWEEWLLNDLFCVAWDIKPQLSTQ